MGFHGRVIDAQFEVPLVARIMPDRGPGVVSDAPTGSFGLEPGSTRPSELVVSAAGFEEARVSLEDLDERDPLEIRLRSDRRAAVIVENQDGSPAPNLPVEWRSGADETAWQEQVTSYNRVDSSAQRQGKGLATTTDSLGRSSVAASGVVLAVIADVHRQVSKTVSVLPGQQIRVVLPADTFILQVVDYETREPLAGLELAAWFPREATAMAEVLETDGDGRVRIAATSSPLFVRRPGSSVWLSELIPLSDGMRRHGFGGPQTMIRIDAPPGKEPLLVGLRSCGGRVRLVDGESGEPIEGPVRHRVRSKAGRFDEPRVPGSGTLFSPRSTYGGIDEVFQAHHGLLDLSCTIQYAEEFRLGIHPTHELVLFATGYRPYAIGSSTTSSLEDPHVPTFELTPAPSRMLRIIHRDGSPLDRQLSIYSPDEDAFCLWSKGTSDGLYGPFEWFGGPVKIQTFRPPGEWWIPAAELETGEVVTLTIPSHSGSILVQDIPPWASELVLIATLQHSIKEHLPTELAEGTCRFDHLPAGSYLIGPRDWVRGAHKHSTLPSNTFVAGDGTPLSWRHAVAKGETTVVLWDDSWAAGRTFEGQVRVLGEGKLDIFLVPFHVPGGAEAEGPENVPRMIFGRNSPRIPLDAQGRYRIGALDPLPRLLVICAPDDTVWGGSGLHVLDVIAPGESVDIATASIELHWRGSPPDQGVTVDYEVPRRTYRHPLSNFNTRSRSSWGPDQVLRIDGIPLHVDTVRIEQRPLPIALRPGVVQRIEVDFAELPPPAGGR